MNLFDYVDAHPWQFPLCIVAFYAATFAAVRGAAASPRVSEIALLMATKLIIWPAMAAAGPALIGWGAAWAQGKPLTMGLAIGAGIGFTMHWFEIPGIVLARDGQDAAGVVEEHGTDSQWSHGSLHPVATTHLNTGTTVCPVARSSWARIRSLR